MENLKLKIIVALIAILMAPLSLSIPHVPITLQTLTLLTAACILAPKEALIFGLIYLALGAVGVPVFGSFTSGFQKLAGPTAGFLWAFPLACLFISWDIRQHPPYFIHLAISFFKAHLIVLIPGLVVLYFSLPGVVIWDTIVKLLPGLMLKSILGPLLVLALRNFSKTAV